MLTPFECTEAETPPVHLCMSKNGANFPSRQRGASCEKMGTMKSEKEMRLEIRQIRERVKSLSGFWIGEASAAIYALEWAMENATLLPRRNSGNREAGARRSRPRW